ncbi:MAG: DapH/DapD/GlmU-related protein [bacterium]
MYRQKKQTVWASDIAEYLNAELHGSDILLKGPQAVRTPTVNKSFCKAGTSEDPWLLLSTDVTTPSDTESYVLTAHPERDLALVLREFFASLLAEGIHPTAIVSSDVMMGRNVHVGAHAVIDAGVELGDSVWVMNHVVIHGPARIGRGTIIKDGAIVGSEGYGFVMDENGQRVHPPQLGRVIIGENAWVGAHATIERGMLVDTVIQDGVKIDDLVHIGNGSRIGRNSMITAGCVVAYNVEIGENVTLAPNVSVRECCRIASGVLIGQGGVVIQNIDVPGTYVGVPVRGLETTK